MSSSAPAVAARAERRTGAAILLLCLVAYAYVIPRGPDHNPDSRLALTYSLVERGSLSIDGYEESTADRALRDGHYYSDKAPGVSFWLAPLYAVVRGLPLPDVDHASDRFVVRYLLTFLGIGVPGAAFATWLFHWSRRFVTPIGPRAGAVIAYALGSPAYAFSVHAFGHVPASMCLFAGAVLAGGRTRMAALGGLALGGAVAFEYPAVLPTALLVVMALFRPAPGRRRTRGAAIAAGGAIPLGLLALYHALAFGAPWRTGYAYVDPAGPFAAAQAAGLLGVGWPDPRVAVELLAGTKRGLVIVAPWLALAVPGALLLWRSGETERRRWVASGAAVFGALLLVNSAYVVWDGGASWGPRHLVPALPFLTVLGLPAFARWPRAAWALACLSVALTVIAVATGTLPPSGTPNALADFLLPALRESRIGNTLGHAVGLTGWRALVPLGGAALVCSVWGRGLRRSYGAALAGALALWCAAHLDARYVEYAEGYYLYLGARIAGGAALYREIASTQAPLPAAIVAALWQVLPGISLPRVVALGCYVAAALLAGALAARLSGMRATAPLATGIAALLPLGATSPAAFDANALLAPLAPALALLLTPPSGDFDGRARWKAALGAGALAAFGVGLKLTFVPLALAPLVPLLRCRRWLAAYAVGLSVAGGAILLRVAAWSGEPALDGLLGELESPLHPAGAALALLQLVGLEGAALATAGLAWWTLRGRVQLHAARAVALASALLPLLALHQGTFVSVARPAEPMIAAYAACAVVWLAARFPRLANVPALILTGAVLASPVAAMAQGRPALRAASGERPPRWVERHRSEHALVPPHLAAHARLRMPFDYADWTVLGMRAGSGVRREAEYAARLTRELEDGALPLVVADFRLGYVPGALAALERGYVLAASEGSGPLEIMLWLPRRSAAGVP